MTHNWKIKKQKVFLFAKNFPPNKRHPGIEMNITGTLPSDKLPIFFLKPNFTSRHACLEVKITRVYDMID
jgi:hypothetical protein